MNLWFNSKKEGFPAPMPYTWKSVVSGGGGFIPGIIFHPACKGLCYLRTDMGGAYRRDTAAGPWQCVTDMFGMDEAHYNGVLSMAVDPADPERVYMMNGKYTGIGHPDGAFHASTDRGRTWKRTRLPFKIGGNERGRGAGERLAVDPNKGSIIFMGSTKNGLWRSDNYGARWARLGQFRHADVNFAAFFPASGSPGRPTGTVFAAVNEQGASLYRSDDCGIKWHAVPGQPQGLVAVRAAISGRKMYITYSDTPGPFGVKRGGVWKYDIIDNAMQELFLPAGEGGFSGVDVDRNNPARIVVSTLNRTSPHDEVFISEDAGGTWHSVIERSKWDGSFAGYTGTMTPHWISDVKFDPFDGARALFTTGYGIWTSRSISAAGAEWFFDNEGVEESVPIRIISPHEGAPLVSAMGDIDGFRHEEFGRSPENRHMPWRGTTLGMDSAGLKPLLFVKAFNSRLPYGAYSMDGGKNWTDFVSCPEGTLRGGVRSIAVSADGGSIVWQPEGAAMSWSDDYGATWQDCAGGFSGTLWPVSCMTEPGVFYLYDGVRGMIWISRDGGKTFRRGAAGLKAARTYAGNDGMAGFELASVPGGRGELWAAAGRKGLYRSVDHGKKFRKTPAVTAAYRIGFGRNRDGAAYPAIFIWGKVKGSEGFFRSLDCGASWERINDGNHQYGWIHCIIGDPRVFGRCYVAAEGRGVLYGEEIQE